MIEKKEIDAAQVESIKDQLKIHTEQRAEWQENTNQMKQRLKEKRAVCASIETKLALLKNLQQHGEIRSSLAIYAQDKHGQNGASAQVGQVKTNGLAKKSKAEEELASKMALLKRSLAFNKPKWMRATIQGLRFWPVSS